MFLGFGSRILLQAAYFILLARFLGVREYGAFVAIASMVAIVSPFSGLGAGNILMMKVAREPSHFAQTWGKALLLALTSAAVLTVAIIAIAPFVLPRDIGRQTILLVTLADLLGPRLAELASLAFGAFDQFRWTAVLQASSTGFRTVAAAIMVVTIHHPHASQWVWFYAVSSILMSVFALGAVTAKLGLPSFQFTHLGKDMKDGVFYSISMSAQTIYNDIDKTMLSRLSTLSATGIYAAAYRIVDLGCAPLRSITAATYPIFFREGQKGLGASYLFGKKIFYRAAAISGAMTLGMLVFAPLLPRVLGSGFNQSIEALRWLAVLPILKSIHIVLGDALTGAGHQRIRASMQIAVAVFNVGINFWLIAAYSWRGAAWSSLASDGLLAGLIVCSILLLRRTEVRVLHKQSQVAG